jgi:hypothetical protein
VVRVVVVWTGADTMSVSSRESVARSGGGYREWAAVAVMDVEHQCRDDQRLAAARLTPCADAPEEARVAPVPISPLVTETSLT